MPTSLALYEEMSSLSARMVEAARAQDWELLIHLERSVAALRNTLLADDEVDLSSSSLKLKSELIQRILADDAEVRRYTEPWMEQLRKFLGTSARTPLEQSYGTRS